MKLVGLTFAAALAAFGAASAQEPAAAQGPPGLAVVGQRWEKIYRNPALEEDPLIANDQQRAAQRNSEESLRRQRELERARSEGNMRQQITVKQSILLSAPSTLREDRREKRRDPWTTYVYRAKIRNDSTREVRSVIWDYAFADPETGQEVGRHRLLSEVRIRPGKNGELIGRSWSPPVRTVDASGAEARRGREKYAERVFILRVDYADGTHWQHPDTAQPR